jgi:Pyruvate/2-oxoacid:ferredoxin oxidoreductase delta subunit
MQKTGIFLLTLAVLVFISLVSFSPKKLTSDIIRATIDKQYHREMILEKASDLNGKTFENQFQFVPKLRNTIQEAQRSLEEAAKIENWQATAIPEGVNEWDFRMGDGDVDNYVFQLSKAASAGFPAQRSGLLFWLTTGLAILGGILYILPKFQKEAGIQHDGIYFNSMTRGTRPYWRYAYLVLTILGIVVAGFYKNTQLVVITLLAAGLIAGLTWWEERKLPDHTMRSAAPNKNAWIGILTGTLLIGFYVLLYWYPEYISNWILMVDPLSRAISGNPASQWFLYGFLYTVVMLVMGIRMIAKYRHNNYQLIRTGSVLFFQTGFAFLIPEILVRLNQPYFDFKNMWPLDYDFFFEWNINNLIQSGQLGLFMLVWGIALFVIGVPVFTFFFGKRWYCSWVCGCGGLAETLGDPYRQLSDKSLRAWRIERWLIHGVLVFSVIMTAMVLYTYFTNSSQILGFDSYQVRSWYGFLIGSAFAGVVGTGFYPLMGNRVWCRFGCPLAAYLGMVQRFKSRFRITTNGGQCISCGNCSTYCEMGIDVRWYAQRGQDIVRSSCVGCGVCAAVCPRGVLRLENSSMDVNTRAEELRVLQIDKEGVRLGAGV